MINKSILFAEDETIIAIDIKTILKKNGFTDISVFNDGEEMAKRALSEPPGLIISDIILKNNTRGTKAAEKVWKVHDVPVLFISGLDMKKYKRKYDPSKCEFLKKPFGEEQLITAVNRLLKITS